MLRPIRSTLTADVLVCPWRPEDTGTLYVYHRAKQDFFKCFGCGAEGYAVRQPEGSYRLRKQAFRNISVNRNRRVAVP